MATNIHGLAEGAASMLETLHTATPERDMEEMKTEAKALYLPSNMDKQEWLRLAGETPDDLVISNTQVYGEIYSNGEAIIDAALNSKAEELENP